jgi:hypothetical protein
MIAFITVVMAIVRRPSSSFATTCPLAMNKTSVIIGAMVHSTTIVAFASSFKDPFERRQLIVDCS